MHHELIKRVKFTLKEKFRDNIFHIPFSQTCLSFTALLRQLTLVKNKIKVKTSTFSC